MKDRNQIAQSSLLLASFSIAFSFTGIALASEGSMHTSTIYGEDSRKDLYETKDALSLKLADATVAILDRASVMKNGKDNVTLLAQSYAANEGLCPGEKFIEQNAAAWCSGTLIAPNVILTAGHCVETQDACEKAAFAFNYSIERQGRVAETVAKTDVYTCKKLLKQVLVEDKNHAVDYAIVELDRNVVGHAPVQMTDGKVLSVGAPLIVIGHPSGLPTKIADGKVRDTSYPDFYVTNLDTFAGNSGSGVFNRRTGALEGILVRGGVDFRYDIGRGCSVSYVNPENGGEGEAVTRMTASVLAEVRAAVKSATDRSPSRSLASF